MTVNFLSQTNFSTLLSLSESSEPINALRQTYSNALDGVEDNELQQLVNDLSLLRSSGLEEEVEETLFILERAFNSILSTADLPTKVIKLEKLYVASNINESYQDNGLAVLIGNLHLRDEELGRIMVHINSQAYPIKLTLLCIVAFSAKQAFASAILEMQAAPYRAIGDHNIESRQGFNEIGSLLQFTNQDIIESYFSGKIMSFVQENRVEEALSLVEVVEPVELFCKTSIYGQEFYNLLLYKLVEILAQGTALQQDVFPYWKMLYWLRVGEINCSVGGGVQVAENFLAYTSSLLYRHGYVVLHFPFMIDAGEKHFCITAHETIFSSILGILPGAQLKADEDKNLPIHLAAECYHPSILALLCSNTSLSRYLGATEASHPAAYMNRWNQLPLHVAAGYDGEVDEEIQLYAIEKLLQCHPNGAYVKDLQGKFPFDYAVEEGKVARGVLLLTNSIDLLLRSIREQLFMTKIKAIKDQISNAPWIMDYLREDSVENLARLFSVAFIRLGAYQQRLVHPRRLGTLYCLPMAQQVAVLNRLAEVCFSTISDEEKEEATELLRNLPLNFLPNLTHEAFQLFLAGGIGIDNFGQLLVRLHHERVYEEEGSQITIGAWLQRIASESASAVLEL